MDTSLSIDSEPTAHRLAMSMLNRHGYGTPGTSMGIPSQMLGSSFQPDMSEDTKAKIELMQRHLNKKLGPEMLSSRQGGGGTKLTYIEAWRVIQIANDIFGFSGWCSEIKTLEVDFIDHDAGAGRYSIGVSALVRITLRDGCFREDIGYGKAENVKSKSDGLDKAKKEAVTDALKRAFRTFGNLLGNCLYDKAYVAEPKVDVGSMYRSGSIFDPNCTAPAAGGPPPKKPDPDTSTETQPVASTSVPARPMPPPPVRAPPPANPPRGPPPVQRGGGPASRGRGGAMNGGAPRPPPPLPPPAPVVAPPAPVVAPAPDPQALAKADTLDFGDDDDAMFADMDLDASQYVGGPVAADASTVSDTSITLNHAPPPVARPPPPRPAPAARPNVPLQQGRPVPNARPQPPPARPQSTSPGFQSAGGLKRPVTAMGGAQAMGRTESIGTENRPPYGADKRPRV